jgi:hypothetical protein
LPQDEPVPIPGPSVPGGFEFSSRAARTGATVTGAIENLTKIVNTFKQRDQQKTAKRAEVLSRSLYDALERGDEETINEILTDKKNMKVLEKAGIGVPPEIKEVEPPSPEQQGVQQGLRFAIRAKAAPAAQAQQLKSQGDVVAQQQRLADLKASEAARRLAYQGSALSPEQVKQAEQWEAGFSMNPVQREVFNNEMRLKDKELGISVTKLNNDLQMWRGTDAFEKMKFGQTMEETKRVNSAQIRHWDTLADLERLRLELEKKRATSQDEAEIFKAYSALAEGYSSQLNTLRTQMTELMKADTPEATGLAQIYRQTETDIQSAVDNAKSIVDLYMAEKEMKKLLEESKEAEPEE